MNAHPHHCGGPDRCSRCDNIVAAREDRSPAPVPSLVHARELAARATLDPGNGPQCTVTWRDGWRCTGDTTGLHSCRKYGPHTVHSCDSQSISDGELAEMAVAR